MQGLTEKGKVNVMSIPFIEFPKIARLNRPVVVTEKIDGTNAQIYISDTSEPITLASGRVVPFLVGSRTRWIFPENDNYGFAKWAYEHADELLRLGPGSHFGEWWGAGIQRRYNLGASGERRFSLFNVGRWHDVHGTNEPTEKSTAAPACCHVVPRLAVLANLGRVSTVLDTLRISGSKAAPGFMQPEGVVVYHEASKTLFKVTCEKDEEWKGRNVE